ncbi:MAG: PilN domain-containing protein [Acidobacteria bacterium]|nr:PilN domain-containing protein [Acidobacteriota bacterium]
MIKINLVAEITPQAAARRAKKREISLGAKQGDILLLSVLLLSFLVTGGMWYHLSSKRAHLEKKQAELRVERDKLKVFIDKVAELETKREALQHKINIIDELKRNQHGPVRIMDEVSRALPDLLWLDKMTVKGNVVSLAGRAMDENAVANYISNLDASPFFQEPTLGDLARSGKGVYTFRLTCVFTLKPPEIKGAGEGNAAAGVAK